MNDRVDHKCSHSFIYLLSLLLLLFSLFVVLCKILKILTPRSLTFMVAFLFLLPLYLSFVGVL